MPSIGVNLRVTGHCSQGGRKYMEDFFSVAYQQSFVDEHDLEYAFIGIYDGEFIQTHTHTYTLSSYFYYLSTYHVRCK